MNGLKQDVFISYARKDYVDQAGKVIPGNPISAIRQRLEQEGISYWFDEEGIYSGQNFVDKIVTNLEASRLFLFLSTANANQSDWTCKEIASAAELGKPIIPVRIDSTPYNRKVMFRIADIDYVPYYQNPEKGMDSMVESIRHHLEELAAREQKRREEAERRRAEEQRRAEEEQRRRAEEERRHQEEQRQLAASIRIRCKEQKAKETEYAVAWDKLLLDADRIKDAALRDEMKTLIADSRPKQEASQNPELLKDYEQLTSDNQRLKSENTRIAAENRELRNINQRLDTECASMKQEIEAAKKSIADTDTELAKLRKQAAEKPVQISTMAKKTNRKILAVVIAVVILFAAIIVVGVNVIRSILTDKDYYQELYYNETYRYQDTAVAICDYEDTVECEATANDEE